MSSTIIQPGPGLTRAAALLENPKRLAGKWPYQWLFPGPSSRQVLANNQAPCPTGPGGVVALPMLTVPDGMRFSLRAIVFGFFGSGWAEGTTTGLSFTLQVQAAGTRSVDFLQNVLTHLGSADQPYPILGRLEFAPLDVLIVQVTNNGSVVAGGPPNTVFAHLVGHTYPNSETVG